MLRHWLPVAAIAAGLAGCVTVPEQQHALVLETDGTVAQRNWTCAHPGATASAGEGALDAHAVRIASWNLHKEVDPGWQADLADLVARSDVLLLQEAGLVPQLRTAIERGGLGWVLASSFAYLDAEYGVLTAARVRPAAACTLRAYEPLLGIPKSALLTYFRVIGRDEMLAVANLHAVNFAPGSLGYHAQLEALGDALAAHFGPLVIAGDFNTWNEARDGEVRALAARLSLAPVAFPIDARRRFLGRIFDWVYVRGVEVHDATAWEVTSSDHNPLLVTFRIR
ncbi:MAG: endonuclease/exonuclease/phosphatase family protein [Pseudomonadota bacterium]|nr:endonuclease/exonuclease/phosphatase family protein [Pseudomonadota bacterium]